jgi:hypothetical protein
MPEAFTQWRCCTCGKTHWSYGEAERCEGDHIVNKAVDGFKAKLDSIFAKGKRRG